MTRKFKVNSPRFHVAKKNYIQDEVFTLSATQLAKYNISYALADGFITELFDKKDLAKQKADKEKAKKEADKEKAKKEADKEKGASQSTPSGGANGSSS